MKKKKQSCELLRPYIFCPHHVLTFEELKYGDGVDIMTQELMKRHTVATKPQNLHILCITLVLGTLKANSTSF